VPVIWPFRNKAECQVLMICTANICRSPAAEGLLRASLKPAGLSGRVAVRSAGLQVGTPGHPPDPRMVNLARERGVRLSGIRARPIDAAELADAAFVYVMEQAQKKEILRRFPDVSAARVALLDPEGDIDDPYYAGIEAVRQTFEHIEVCVHERLREIAREVRRR
jgi:protein-tyrosine phosphatase